MEIQPQSLQKTPQQILSDWWKTEDVKSLCKYFFKVNITPMQEEIVREVAYDKHKRLIICCMTRYGKSFCVALGILLWIMRNKNRRIAIIAPTNDKTMIIRNYIAHFVVQCPYFLALLDITKTGYERIQQEVSKRRMTWKNGVEMRTLSAEGQGEALMGFGADKLIVDEVCDIDFEVHRAKITRMLGDNPESSFIGIGNPWIKTNQMWQMWINPEWHKIHIGWETALKEGRISQVFLDEQRAQLAAREFQVLYDAIFPEDTEDQLISWAWIQKAIQ